MRLSLLVLVLAISACGQVRYHFGDDPRWSDPKFDDRSWPSAGVDQFPIPSASSDGMVWLRFRVLVPPDASPLAIGLTRENADCVPYEVWVNGARVGNSGSFPPNPEVRTRCSTDVFDLPASLVSPGGTAVVAWRGWIPPFFRTALPYIPPQAFSIGIGARDHMQSRARNAVGGVRVSFEMEVFLDFAGLLLGSGLFTLWWRTSGGRALLWFSLAVLWWNINTLWIDGLAFWRPDYSYTFYWWGVCAYSIPLNIAWFEFMGTSLQVPKWTIRGLEVAGVVWPVLWFPPVLAVVPSPFLYAVGSIGIALFGVQTIGQAALAFWVILWGPRETRTLAGAFALAAVVNLLVDVIMVLPHYVVWGGQRLFTDNLSQGVVYAVMGYLLLRRMLLDWRAKEELNAEFEAAREMQQRLVPRAPETPGFLIDSAYHPARHVGGDFFRVLRCEGDGAVLIVVGDVSGKGLGAAMTVAAIAGALDNEFSRDPGQVLEHLNRALLLRNSHGFATCCAARLALSGEVRIANAGHLAPYHDCQELTIESDLPLGLSEDVVYRETRTNLAVGRTLTFLSDGVVEAANAAGELFGFERARAISECQPSAIADAARAFGQNDDITVVTVRRNA